ncbi:hypothetical protein LWI29_005598 [Acer saccharum]|uniref:Uncharacterized protein n=1 Tax=Acer saccharum TaxID=4024 RepID=A0AA39V6H5_ACESA|nr:hypothetical protein LWI29_005598 [Acer saccharum]
MFGHLFFSSLSSGFNGEVGKKYENPSGENKDNPILVEDHIHNISSKKGQNVVDYGTRGALSRAELIEKMTHCHSLGDSVVSPEAIPCLTFTYHIPKSVTLLAPPVGHDPIALEEGDLLLPLYAFDQGL